MNGQPDSGLMLLLHNDRVIFLTVEFNFVTYFREMDGSLKKY